jgi:hypothetical protein
MFRAFLEKQKRWLEWPPALFTYVEAAWRAKVQLEAAEAVAQTAERVYRRTDSHSVSFQQGPFDYRIPGVANEFWPSRDVPPGGENYGWGATLPMNIIRAIIGFREGTSASANEFHLAPAFPPQLMIPGKVYTTKNLHYRGMTFDVAYRCGSGNTVAVSLDVRSPKGIALLAIDAGNSIVARSETKAGRGALSFSASNGKVYTIQWE